MRADLGADVMHAPLMENGGSDKAKSLPGLILDWGVRRVLIQKNFRRQKRQRDRRKASKHPLRPGAGSLLYAVRTKEEDDAKRKFRSYDVYDSMLRSFLGERKTSQGRNSR